MTRMTHGVRGVVTRPRRESSESALNLCVIRVIRPKFRPSDKIGGRRRRGRQGHETQIGTATVAYPDFLHRTPAGKDNGKVAHS